LKREPNILYHQQVREDASVYAIVPAAGSSLRMGQGVSKLRMQLGDTSVLERSLSTLLACESISEIIVPLRPEDREYVEDLPGLKSAFKSGRLNLVNGGATRQGSVYNALQALAGKCQPESLVLVHDAARCFVSGDIILAAVQAARQYSAVTVAIPCADSLKRVDSDGCVLSSISREGMWLVQTPQVFTYELLRQAHEHHLAKPDGGEPTDDACLVEALHPVHTVEGSRLNFKITNPADYAFALSVSRMG
jgi:2-C-methyl-D-erythritol 4-phosphate cytidylyltransferase